jgi:long-chain acyl-CoA synthetase
VRPHLGTLLTDFRRHGRQIAIVTHRGNRSFPCTWEQLADWSARFANELGHRGLRQGDRLLLWGDNSAEWVAAFFGCVLRGVIAVPLDAAGSTEFARGVVAEVRPKLIVGNPELIDRLDSAPWISSLGFDQFPGSLRAPDYHPFPNLSRDSILQIVFTSGTTAEPKGIVHTHGNVLASLDTLEQEIDKYRRYERIVHPLRILHTLPLSHVFGQFMGLWVPPLLAAEVHYESRLEASRLIRMIREERISVLAAVPRVLDLLRSHVTAEMPGLPEKLSQAAGLKFWKRWWRLRKLHRRFGFKFWAFVSGGAALPSDLETFWTTAGFALIQGYGMTETTALVTLTHPFKPTRGSIGKTLPGREIEIGPDGEILVRGASIADRTWQQGKMHQRTEDWLRTGDLVARDSQGELIFSGRKGDVIVTAAGINIHPGDLETVLRRQAHVRDAVVVPYASPSGQVPAAILILDSAAPSGTSAERPVEVANRDLAAFQQILYSLVWPQPDFPRTSTGKILRRQIQSWAQQSLSYPSGAAGTPANGLADPLLDLLHRIQPASRNRPIADSDRLSEDLHLDSLASVQLQAALESRFAVEIDDPEWQQVRTVGELRARLSPAPAQPVAPVSSFPAASARQRARPAQPRAQVRAQVFPHWPWWPVVRALRIGFLEVVMRSLVGLLLAPQVERRAAISRPSLLVANHLTAIDVPIILNALPAADRGRVAVAMSAEVLEDLRTGKVADIPRIVNLFTPIAYWLIIALFNVFPLPRRSGLRQSFAHAGEALDRGYHVLVFPEGGRSADGRLQAFEPGVGLLAQESQVMVQPIYVAGLAALKERPASWSPRFWFRPGPLAVRLGEPLSIAPGEAPASFARRLRSAVLELGEDDPANVES